MRHHDRKLALMAVIATVAATSAVSEAHASPAVVDVRIEGQTQTLFEGPIRTEGHSIEASSDTQPRACDGTNAGAHASPGPTPTAAAVDAMRIAGETFDGQWNPGYDDYFITRWGPDRENVTENEYWALLRNGVITPRGGCQIELGEGDQVLWMYDGFSGRHFLALSAAGDESNPPPATATVALGQPLTVEVTAYTSSEGTRRELGPFAGADVSPVSTAVNGFESTETGNPATVVTGSTGAATLTFSTPGWHRIKASAEGAFRSNRLDVCVPPEGMSGCGALPADDQVRSIIPTPPPEQTPPPERAPAAEPTPSPGPEQRTLSAGGPPTSPLASHEPAEPSRVLRLDGYALMPLDDRALAIHYRGHWRAIAEPAAWLGTLMLGATNATLSVRLPAGRPAFIVRDVRRRARLELLAGGHRELVTIAASSSAASRLVIGLRRTHAGTVKLRVLKGAVGIDGVATIP